MASAAPRDNYLHVQKEQLAHAATNLSEHFDSVLILCSGEKSAWFLAERGNDFASCDLARRYLSGFLRGAPPADDDEVEEYDFKE